MSVSIRHRHNYRNVIINPEKAVQGGGVSGTLIPALLKNGEYCYKPFGGVMDDSSAPAEAQAVKLVNITAFWWDESGFGPAYEIPIGDAVKGYLVNERYYVAIKDDKPLHWQISQGRKEYHTDNVINIHRKNT